MNFVEHIEKQWSDYEDRHCNRTNLLIHIVAVPVAWIGTFQVIGGLLLMLMGVPGGFGMLVWGVVVFGASVFVQMHGDGMEARKTARPGDPLELAKAIAAEQFVNFPRFVASGAWLRNLRSAG